MERLDINLISKSYDDQTRHRVNIRKSLVCGFFMQVAHKGDKGSYVTVKENQVCDLDFPLTCVLTSSLSD